MAIQPLNIGAAPGDGTGDTLRSSQDKVNDNFSVSENAASKIVQASSADTTSDKVMMSDYAWRGAQLGDYFTYGGTANAITLTSANLAAGGTLIAGMKFRFKATLTNTGATTITVDGGSTVSCVTPTGVALPAGFIRTDVITECEYDGANFVVSRKIESGSDANGSWTIWENGTKEHSYFDSTARTTSTASGSVFIIPAAITYNFSSSFASTPIVIPYGSRDVTGPSGVTWANVSATSPTSVTIFLVGSAATSVGGIGYTATGKWY